MVHRLLSITFAGIPLLHHGDALGAKCCHENSTQDQGTAVSILFMSESRSVFVNFGSIGLVFVWLVFVVLGFVVLGFVVLVVFSSSATAGFVFAAGGAERSAPNRCR